jgi:hypothetical protein
MISVQVFGGFLIGLLTFPLGYCLYMILKSEWDYALSKRERKIKREYDEQLREELERVR